MRSSKGESGRATPVDWSKGLSFALTSRSSSTLDRLSYGLRRMRWRGLARAAAQVRFTAIAYNLKRSLNILAA
jgi:IS5 family transposase